MYNAHPYFSQLWAKMCALYTAKYGNYAESKKPISKSYML